MTLLFFNFQFCNLKHFQAPTDTKLELVATILAQNDVVKLPLESLYYEPISTYPKIVDVTEFVIKEIDGQPLDADSIDYIDVVACHKSNYSYLVFLGG